MSSSKRKGFDSDSMEVESKRAKDLMVSFSKRRQGLFSKASELCSKFDAQIAVLVLSPSENPFSFGHSSVDDVVRRYNNLVGQTTVTLGGEENAVDERQRSQERELEELRVRVRDREKERVRRESLNLNTLINVESCESVEELEGFKLKCLALLHMIREKLRDDSSFVASGSFHVAGTNNNAENFNLLHRRENDMSLSVVDSVAAGSAATMVHHQANENNMSFSLAKYDNYGGN